MLDKKCSARMTFGEGTTRSDWLYGPPEDRDQFQQWVAASDPFGRVRNFDIADE